MSDHKVSTMKTEKKDVYVETFLFFPLPPKQPNVPVTQMVRGLGINLTGQSHCT